MGTAPSIIIAMIACPLIAAVAVKMGPWEYFALSFMAITLVVSISKGNMLKTLIGTILYFALSLYVWGWMAELYTAVAVSVGFELASSTMLITCTCFMPFLALLFAAFLSQNPIWIGLTVVVYFVAYFFYRKNKEAVLNYMLTCNDVKAKA